MLFRSDSPVDDVLGYLAMEDFNDLPLEERMRYLGEFASRFRGFQQEESAATAAFLAGVTGDTREQMRQNARVLAKDVLLEGAEGLRRREGRAARGGGVLSRLGLDELDERRNGRLTLVQQALGAQALARRRIGAQAVPRALAHAHLELVELGYLAADSDASMRESE